jgi:nitroreductase
VDAYTAIVSKRDTRSYRPDPIPDDVLGRVLQAGRMAGSAKNSQLTRLVLATDPAVRERLAACGDFTSWIGSAPAVLVFVVPTEGGRLFDVGRMAQNVMVAGNALGLASCPVTFQHQDRLRDVLGLPATYDGPMGMTLGLPADAPEPNPLQAPRVPLDELVHRDRWTGER